MISRRADLLGWFGQGVFASIFIFAWCLSLVSAQAESPSRITLLDDDFDNMPAGALSSAVGAHTEYHFLSESAPIGHWAISTFRSDIGSQLAWKAIRQNGEALLAQTYANKKYRHYHPMVISGDSLWRNYTLQVRFVPQSQLGLSGVVFRYRNDRCYYFFGVDGKNAVLKSVAHATAFHKPFEKTLDSTTYDWEAGKQLIANVSVEGEEIRAWFEQGPSLSATDSTYSQGKIGLVADVPTHFHHVTVTTNTNEQQHIREKIAERERIEGELQASNPRLKLWKKIKTEGFGVGRNLRFGDLDGDGEMDVLIGQVLHHGPKDRNSELSCLTAMTLDGKMLWQIGEPDPWKDHLTNDVGFQIHDLDNDGSNEVIYCMNMQLHVANGATGETKQQTPMPGMPANTPPPYNKFQKVLGDSIYFCDLRATGHDRDIVIKDRYRHIWALDDRLQIRWSAECNTGHYPFAYDIDDDGRDEIAIGYSLFDGDGKQLWSLDNQLKDHADGVAIVQFEPDSNIGPRLLCAASDEGMFFADIQGHILKHHYIGHVQNPAVANFRPDLPGLESVSINYWGNQGIIHLYDARGNIYHDFEPCQHGSMCLPINWDGSGSELFVLSANVAQGGLFDGWGRRVVKFPNDGHPDMCNAVLDITGDCRDEIVVWDPNEVWVYTQDDNPKTGRLYKPIRNPLYNYSNYQTTVSLPRWSEDDSRPRVIATTDGEVDDRCSMVRFLLYANEWDIEGLIYSSSKYHWVGHNWAGTEWIERDLDLYATSYENLRKHSSTFPSPQSLKDVTFVGNIENVGEMKKVTPGSQHIVQVLLDDQPGPVYLQAWGGTNTIARALKTIQDQHPDEMDRVSKKAILFLILDQDPTFREYIQPNWPDLQTLISHQFGAIAYDWDRHIPQEHHSLFQGPWMREHILLKHGPLCARYEAHKKKRKRFVKDDFRSEGDSPAFMHQIRNGLGSLHHPNYGGWGGRFVLEKGTTNVWKDARDDKDRKKPIWRWAEDFQNDWAARADWCVKSFEEANHNPILVVNGNAGKEIVRIDAKIGTTVPLSASGSTDPDGDTLTYHWWHYAGPSEYDQPVKIEGADQREAKFTVPIENDSKEHHIILQVRDNGSPPLTAYRRVIVRTEGND